MADEKEICGQKLHEKGIIIDGTMVILRDYTQYLRKILDGGLTAVVLTLVANENFITTIKSIYEWYERLEEAIDFTLFVEKASDIQRAKREGKLGIIFACQSGSPIEDDIGYLSVLKKLGVRVMALAYNQRNLIGDGSTERSNCGLSEFGVAVVSEMNRLGIVIDLSHCGDQTTLEAMELSERPVVISHSNARALCDHPRNVSDEIIQNLAAKGGVLGINAYPGFLKKGGNATFSDFLDHIDHAVNLVGTEHVGLGLDIAETRVKADYMTKDGQLGFGKTKYDPNLFLPWPWYVPEAIDSVSKFSNIAKGLVKRGYGDDDVLKIIGGNYQRLFHAVFRE
jgi:membrane dipeptidase